LLALRISFLLLPLPCPLLCTLTLFIDTATTATIHHTHTRATTLFPSPPPFQLWLSSLQFIFLSVALLSYGVLAWNRAKAFPKVVCIVSWIIALAGFFCFCFEIASFYRPEVGGECSVAVCVCVCVCCLLPSSTAQTSLFPRVECSSSSCLCSSCSCL
jgi:hypothetical protein